MQTGQIAETGQEDAVFGVVRVDLSPQGGVPAPVGWETEEGFPTVSCRRRARWDTPRTAIFKN